MSTLSSPALAATSGPFVERRSYDPGVGHPVKERRQFSNCHEDLSPEACALALAIDEYKLVHRQRFITYERCSRSEVLGYRKWSVAARNL
jgi:hypothetical protein